MSVCAFDRCHFDSIVSMIILLQGATPFEVKVHMYAAAAVSLFCFLFTLLVFICLKDLKSNYIYSQINVQLCSFAAIIIFVCGADGWENRVSVFRVFSSFLALECRTAS